jgi:hypothetical protein
MGDDGRDHQTGVASVLREPGVAGTKQVWVSCRMGLTLLTERYADQIAGVLGCWDRMLIFGTLPKICYAAGMTSYLYEKRVRIG